MTEQHKVINVPIEKIKRTTCKWFRKEQSVISWKGSCGIKWDFINEGPLENEMTYCPKCGKKIEVC